MPFHVLLAENAEHDLADIFRFIAEHDAVPKADQVLRDLEDACLSLMEMPERGHVPKELRLIDLTEFREIHHKPYRIIYRIFGETVIVYCVVDGRRNMQSFLERRLLR